LDGADGVRIDVRDKPRCRIEVGVVASVLALKKAGRLGSSVTGVPGYQGRGVADRAIVTTARRYIAGTTRDRSFARSLHVS
jgi:hypothetical protein